MTEVEEREIYDNLMCSFCYKSNRWLKITASSGLSEKRFKFSFKKI
jgi:hypothetical protein